MVGEQYSVFAAHMPLLLEIPGLPLVQDCSLAVGEGERSALLPRQMPRRKTKVIHDAQTLVVMEWLRGLAAPHGSSRKSSVCLPRVARL